MSVVDRSFDHPLKLEENASAPLAGGIMLGYQCGMIWGAALAAGAQAHRVLGPGPLAETAAVLAAQRVVESYRSVNKYINCREVTELDMTKPSARAVIRYILKGGIRKCFGGTARYAPLAFDDITAVLSDGQTEAPSAPVSCAALLAQKMGASDMHQVMAAGLAGGIGLCGGACGALGAAVWLVTMNRLKEGAKKLDSMNPEPKTLETIERFKQASGDEFECSKIVGRRFTDVGDHAAFLREGGCTEIIEVLAAA
jgi:hypothetical protein